MLSQSVFTTTILGLIASSTAFKLNQSWGKSPAEGGKCTRGGPGDDLIDGKYFFLDGRCIKDSGGKDQAMKVTAGDGDAALMVVFFSGNDCNPNQVIMEIDETSVINGKEPGCWDGKYGSFQIWSVCENDKLDCMN
ncbi:uncharacterized protein PG998_011502 [Apiospora kogelbergensis]|uniref:Uncharacterized protein n=1 Tax=Apiospora kogelbergensis TaxID=1337665 RepID=A0AAW0RBW2_9PEZI